MIVLVRANEDCFHIGFRNAGDVFEYDQPEGEELPKYLDPHDGPLPVRYRVPGEMTLGEFTDEPGKNKKKVTDYKMPHPVR